MRKYIGHLAAVVAVLAGCAASTRNPRGAAAPPRGAAKVVIDMSQAPTFSCREYRTVVRVPVEVIRPSSLLALDVAFGVVRQGADTGTSPFAGGQLAIPLRKGLQMVSQPATQIPGREIIRYSLEKGVNYSTDKVKGTLVVEFSEVLAEVRLAVLGVGYLDIAYQPKVWLASDTRYPMTGTLAVTVAAPPECRARVAAAPMKPSVSAKVDPLIAAAPTPTPSPVVNTTSVSGVVVTTTTTSTTPVVIVVREPKDLLQYKRIVPPGRSWSITGLAAGDASFDEMLVDVVTRSLADDADALEKWRATLSACAGQSAAGSVQACMEDPLGKELRRLQEVAAAAFAERPEEKARKASVDACLKKPGIDTKCLKPLVRQGTRWSIADDGVFVGELTKLEKTHDLPTLKGFLSACIASQQESSVEACVRGKASDALVNATKK